MLFKYIKRGVFVCFRPHYAFKQQGKPYCSFVFSENSRGRRRPRRCRGFYKMVDRGW
jgi:hypothetical protein